MRFTLIAALLTNEAETNLPLFIWLWGSNPRAVPMRAFMRWTSVCVCRSCPCITYDCLTLQHPLHYPKIEKLLGVLSSWKYLPYFLSVSYWNANQSSVKCDPIFSKTAINHGICHHLLLPPPHRRQQIVCTLSDDEFAF